MGCGQDTRMCSEGLDVLEKFLPMRVGEVGPNWSCREAGMLHCSTARVFHVHTDLRDPLEGSQACNVHIYPFVGIKIGGAG